MRAWKARSGKRAKKRGRKPKPITFKELAAIAREFKKQGGPGYRPVLHALKGFRERLVRDVVAELKLRKRRRLEKIRQRSRVSIVVKNAGTVTAMDAGAVRRGEEYIVYRDRGSLSVNADKSAGFTSSSDTLRVLNKLKEGGRLPLVLCTDNGSPFCSEPVEDFLRMNQVIHLTSLPRTPQHNGSAENSVGDFKNQLKDKISPERACALLNEHRLRRKLGWKTPAEMEQTNLKLCTQEERREFFDATQAAIDAAVTGTKTAHEKRKAERRAIHETMERFSLITIIRGHRRHA